MSELITGKRRRWLIATAVTALIAVVAVIALTPGTAQPQPAVGSMAPLFELPDQDGRLHAVEDYRGNYVVLYFYPKDQTPGCTTEACEFRDDIFKYRELGARVLGVSLDDVESHKEFAEEHGLPFPLLADPEGVAVDAYGVRTRFAGMEVAARQTFLIDPEGRIARHYVDVDPETHSAQILADLQALTQS